MKTKLSPTLVGAFVLGALALTVVGLVSFGSSRLLRKPGRFIAYFNESVQGLDLGSAVKLRGVRVGRVTAVRIRFDTQTRRSTVAVICDLEHNLITDSHGNTIKITDASALQGLVTDGLRAKLRLTGITGLQVIDLDFFDPKAFPASITNDDAGHLVMPTLPSEFTEFAGSASEVLTRLRRVDFAGLTEDLRLLLTNSNAKISELKIEDMVARVTAAAGAIERLADGAETKAVVTNLNQTLGEVRTLATKVGAQVESLGKEAQESLRSFDHTSDAVRTTLGPESGLREETTKALQQLSEAAASVQRLADFLERNPNAILTGKKPPRN